MSNDPTTDYLRRTMNHPFASRPWGAIDEEGEPIGDQCELAETIRVAVEINCKRSRSAQITPRLRDANALCVAFWKDVARLGISFGFPPKTHIALGRMYDWQKARHERGQVNSHIDRNLPKGINGLAQSELRAACEIGWTSEVLVGG